MPKFYTRSTFRVFLFSLLFFFHSNLTAQPVVNFIPLITSDLSSPLDIVNANDGTHRLFIVERAGLIKIYNGTLLSTPFLDLTDSTACCGEQGLLSMAFHPDFANNRLFYVYYTDNNGDIAVARFNTLSAGANTADPASGKILLRIPHPTHSNHNGGHLAFGPNDGYLYFATGDGGSGGDPPDNAQNGNSLLGKMIRLDVRTDNVAPYYNIPPTNPYISDPNVRDEIWALGLRNPYRWSFDRLNGDMWIGDVGQGLWEEVNFRTNGNTGGINYGWDCYEGKQLYNDGVSPIPCSGAAAYIQPILDYPHNATDGGFSITGGYVYRGVNYPAMYGHYIFADHVSGNVWLLPPGGAAADTIRFPGKLGSITAFGESETGELYATTLNGRLYRVTATSNSALPVDIISFTATAKNSFNEILWTAANEINLLQYEVEYSADGNNFQQAGIVKATAANTYRFEHSTIIGRNTFYRLKMVDNDNSWKYSKIISIKSQSGNADKIIFNSIVINGRLKLNVPNSFKTLHVINLHGSIVYTENISGRTGPFEIKLPALAAGNYVVRLVGDAVTSEKILIR